MLLPESWGKEARDKTGAAGAGGKRKTAPFSRKESAPKKKKPPEADKTGTEPEVSVYDSITRAISTVKPLTSQPMTPDLQTILSRIPYQQMLEELFGGEKSLPVEVPIVTRAYEEAFMRAPDSEWEKPCVMGTNCECMHIDPQHPFVGTEFLLPGEESSEQAQMCVLCSRKVTKQLFHDMLFHGVSFRGVIQRYGNVCEQPGEYSRQCMLVCPPNSHVHCMPLPIVEHQRNRYSVFTNNGVKHLRQHRVYYEDFL